MNYYPIAKWLFAMCKDKTPPQENGKIVHSISRYIQERDIFKR